MSYETRYNIVKQEDSTWDIFIKITGDIFQEGFDSKKDALDFLTETFYPKVL